MSEYNISQGASVGQDFQQSSHQKPPKGLTRPVSAQQFVKQNVNQMRPTTAKVKSPVLETILLDKNKTIPFFKNSKVEACAHVILVDGVPKAMPFYQTPKKSAAEKMTKLAITQSYSQDQFKTHFSGSIGSKIKPLVAYHPNSQRNRMVPEVMKLPQSNVSQILFDDGSTANAKRNFMSSSKNHYGNHANFGFTSNPAILCAMTGRHKNAQGK